METDIECPFGSIKKNCIFFLFFGKIVEIRDSHKYQFCNLIMCKTIIKKKRFKFKKEGQNIKHKIYIV